MSQQHCRFDASRSLHCAQMTLMRNGSRPSNRNGASGTLEIVAAAVGPAPRFRPNLLGAVSLSVGASEAAVALQENTSKCRRHRFWQTLHSSIGYAAPISDFNRTIL